MSHKNQMWTPGGRTMLVLEDFLLDLDMEERELAIWKGIRDALCEPIQNKRPWKPECMTCERYDHIEDTGCFFDKCKLTGESTWIK